MFRTCLMIAAALLTSPAFCKLASADPDHSSVRVSLNKEDSSVVVLGGTRIEIVEAVLRGLSNCKRPADQVTVGPWLGFPAAQKRSVKTPQFTVFISDFRERREKTAYLAVAPETPFSIVSAVCAELRLCGFTNIRLVTEADLLELIDPAGK